MEEIKRQLFDAILKREDKSEVIQILTKHPEIIDEPIEYHEPDEDDPKPRNNKAPPLLAAFSFMDVEMCRILLEEFNADPNKGDSRGTTVLFEVAGSGDAEKILFADLLIEKGADVNQPVDTGKTPLMLSAQEGALLMVQKLLDHDANANAKDDTDKNSLGWMGYYCGEENEKLIDEIVRLLIEAGADPYNIDIFGYTPLSMAKRYKQPLVEKSLLKYMGNVEEP